MFSHRFDAAKIADKKAVCDAVCIMNEHATATLEIIIGILRSEGLDCDNKTQIETMLYGVVSDLADMDGVLDKFQRV